MLTQLFFVACVRIWHDLRLRRGLPAPRKRRGAGLQHE